MPGKTTSVAYQLFAPRMSNAVTQTIVVLFVYANLSVKHFLLNLIRKQALTADIFGNHKAAEFDNVGGKSSGRFHAISLDVFEHFARSSRNQTTVAGSQMFPNIL